jgi:2,4-dienoyl-CoA reductase-like NADH-dependent reductase (Old Yellow Enzyme family)
LKWAPELERLVLIGLIFMLDTVILSAFFANFSTWRINQFGGDLRGRVKLLLEFVRLIRKELKKDFVVTVRMNGKGFVKGGLILELAKKGYKWWKIRELM